MAMVDYAEQLVPQGIRDPITAFVFSGLHQVERVVKGPRPRQKELAEETRLFAWRMKGAPGGVSFPDFNKLWSKDGRKKSIKISRGKASRETAFVLAAIPNFPVLMTDTDTLLPLRLLSDTLRHILAGTAARTMSQAFIHPIDTVKTRLQVNKLTAPLRLQKWRAHSKARTVSITLGGYRLFRFRNWFVQGPVDLYRGITAAIFGTVPVALVYFCSYEACKAQLMKHDSPAGISHLVSASMGAVFSAFLRVPIDTLKHQTQAYMIPNVYQGAKEIMSARGLPGFYNGLLPTLLRDVPELALQFALYERLRSAVEEHRQVGRLRTWEHLLLGGLSGAAAASATMPLDVAKTALQCSEASSVAIVLREVLKQKGVQGLFAGMGPRVAQIALQGAVFFTLFEAWKAQLKPSPLRLEDDRLMAPKLWRKRRDHVWKRQFVFQ